MKPSKPSVRAKDETEIWAESVLSDSLYKGNPLLKKFRMLLEKYSETLKRTDKTFRISDNYQMRLREMNILFDNYARTDPLTGLANRRDILDRMQKEIGRAERFKRTFSLIMIDVDAFKQVNDKYGHAAGDEVLRKLASIINGLLRKTDVCSRWGGEEFLIFLVESKTDGAVVLAERIRKTIASLKLTHDKHRLHITVSLGVSEYRSGQTADNCIAEADKALYKAKQAGKNRVATAR